MNVQYAIKDGDIYVLEVNPRASRTVPFVAKVIGLPVAKIAARIMAGETLKSFGFKPPRIDHVGVKEAVFPFARFPGVDTVLGPEMKSTGEVMGIDHSLRDRLRQEPDRRRRPAAARRHRVRLGQGRRQAAHPRGGAAAELARLQGDRDRRHPALSGRAGGPGRKDQQGGRGPARISSTPSGTATSQLVFNTTEGALALADSRSLRRAALLHKVPYYTTLSGAVAAAQGIKAYLAGDLEVRALQSYFGGKG